MGNDSRKNPISSYRITQIFEYNFIIFIISSKYSTYLKYPDITSVTIITRLCLFVQPLKGNKSLNTYLCVHSK